MDTKKKLIESKPTDQEILSFIDSCRTHPFVQTWTKNYQKHLLETLTEPEMGAVRGQTVGDVVGVGAGAQVAATLEIFNSVIRGFTRYMDDSFVKKYTTEAVQFKLPKVEYRELVADISGGELAHSEKTIDYMTVDLSTPESEKGGKATWTRALLEDVTFDVQAEMMEGMGHDIAVKIMSEILNTLLGITPHKQPLGANYTISDPITWEQFLDVASAVDVGYKVISCSVAGNRALSAADLGGLVTITTGEGAQYGMLSDYKYISASNYTIYALVQGNATLTIDEGDGYTVTNSTGDVYTGTITEGLGGAITDHGMRTYGPADYVLCSTDVYWKLLNIIQLTNVLYEGSTDPIKSGRVGLSLGCTVVKQSLLPKGTIVALNSGKAIALVTRRQLKIEPIIFPSWNEYGFIATVRFGTSLLYSGSIQIGKTA